MLKIALIGPESTGKSTLAAQLAEYFQAAFQPEYAREYVENLGRKYDYEDICAIARKQIEQENAFYKNELIFFDTDTIITKVWFEHCYQQIPPFLSEHLAHSPIDFYLLCAPDLVWEVDSVRENGDKREFFFYCYKREIENAEKPYKIINGMGEKRLENAIKEIEKFMKDNIIKTTSQRLASVEQQNTLFAHCRDGFQIPSEQTLKEIVALLRAIYFPGYFDANNLLAEPCDMLEENIKTLYELLHSQVKAGIYFESREQGFPLTDEKISEIAEEKSLAFIEQLPDIRKVLLTDIMAAYNGDPAAKSYAEIVFCYPAIRAIINYRSAHALLTLDVPFIPRIITEMAHSETGIDIHPAAKIGSFFTIDHGTGVVIGETSVIGDNVKLYQGVTLGARSFPLDENGNPIKGIDRHPKLGNNVIIYSNSTILGNITVGDAAIIGGNIWVDNNVPAGARLVQRR